jgi:photosystem II stability/assembly factor-like uncharacterized protein
MTRTLAAAVFAALVLAGPLTAQNGAAGWSADLFEGLAFRSLGPSLTTGRIADLEVDPRDPSTWYVAAGSGNLWKTVNRGETWTPIFDDHPAYSVGAVVVDPRSSDVVWLGTGENANTRSASYGDGVYKSTDGGDTWRRVGLERSEHIQRILFDPRDPDVVWVAAQGPLWASGGDRGLYKTTDGGWTWTRSLHPSDDTGVTDVALHPGDPDVVYAAAYQRRRAVGQTIGGGPEAGIFKSSDGGSTWRRLTEGLPTVDMGRIALGVDPRIPDRVYALIYARGDAGGFFRSEDAGETWARVSDYAGGDPQYYGEIFVDPHRPETIWNVEIRIRRSTDGGATWEPMDFPIHVDHHEIVFDEADPEHMWIGNDGGLYETWDGGENWRHFTNLPLSQFYRVSADDARAFYTVCGGAQDNGTHCGPARTANAVGIRTSDWIQVGGGDGFQGHVHPERPDLVYRQSQNGNLGRLDLETGESVDIRPLRPDPEGEGGEREEPDRGRWHWDSPLLVSPHAPDRLYFAGNRLYRSDDRGDTWTAVSPDLTRQWDRDTIPIMGRVQDEDAVALHLYTTELSVITAVDESPVLEGLLYVGTDDGLVQVSEDGGGAWRAGGALPGLPEHSYVTDLFASPRNADVVFATFNNWQRGDFRPWVLRSDDRGRTWTNVTGDLPERSGAWSVVQDHVNADLLFVGLEFGVWFTADGGGSWTRLGGGMPSIQARDLQIQRREGDLVVGTFGRGAYVLDDYAPLRTVSAEALAERAWLFPARTAYLYGERGYVEAAWGNETTPNPPFGAVLTLHVGEALAADTTLVLAVTDKDGARVRHVEVPAGGGLRRVAWDLRRDPPPPPEGEGEEAEGRRRPRRGDLVEPGRYRVVLARAGASGVEAVVPPQEVLVVRVDP